MQGALKEPLVVLHAVALEIGLHLGDVPVQSEAGHGRVALGHVLIQIALAVLVIEGFGQLLDVLAVVAVLGEGNLVLAQDELLVAGVDGGGELLDLVAGVVDVKLTPDVIARAVEHARQRVAQHAAAGVAHVHGARGVGGDKLHHQALAVPLVHAAVVRALSGDSAQHVGVPGGGEAEIDKAGAGHLDGGKPAALKIEVFDQSLGDLPGRHVQGAGPGHSVVGGVVAVGGVLGDLHRAGKHGAGGQLTLLHCLCAGRGQQGVYAVLGVLNHVSHLLFSYIEAICFCSLTSTRKIFRVTKACSRSST